MAQPQYPHDLTIAHTNDLHNRFPVRLAERIQSIRAGAANRFLLVDAGDAVASGNITFRPLGERILDLMSAAGYDAGCVGNREYHFSTRGLETKLRRAKFPVLSANIHARKSLRVRSLPALPFVVVERAGWKVALFGLTVPMITREMAIARYAASYFEDPIQTGVRMAADLRRTYKPDLTIALTHIGLKGDRELAQASGEIDLIVGGHSHDKLPEGERAGDTLIVHAGAYGKSLGLVTAQFGPGRPSLTAQLLDI